MLKKEREWIEKLKDSIVNKLRPITTEEENKERQKQYYNKNIEEVKEYNKIYNVENKEKRKKYIVENKEKIMKFWKEYVKEKNKEIYECKCGKKYTFTHKARHTKTQIHQQYINSLVSKSVLKT